MYSLNIYIPDFEARFEYPLQVKPFPGLIVQIKSKELQQALLPGIAFDEDLLQVQLEEVMYCTHLNEWKAVASWCPLDDLGFPNLDSALGIEGLYRTN